MADQDEAPKPGRPSKLTPELQDQLIERIERGVDPDVAAQAAGIDRATYYRWMKAGREDEAGKTPLGRFAIEVARACAEREAKLVERWLDGDEKGVGFGPAKAAAEFLRLTQRRYAEKLRVQVTDELEELLSVVERTVSPEDFARVLEALAARDRGEEAHEAPSEGAAPIH